MKWKIKSVIISSLIIGNGSFVNAHEADHNARVKININNAIAKELIEIKDDGVLILNGSLFNELREKGILTDEPIGYSEDCYRRC